MPHLGGNIRTTKLFLPSTENEPNEADKAYVVINSKLTGGDLIDIEDLETNTQRGLMTLMRIIQSWNLTESDEPGSPLAQVTEENIRRLEQDDFNFLSEWVFDNIFKASKPLADDQKKTSLSISATQSTDTIPPAVTSQPTTIPIN